MYMSYCRHEGTLHELRACIADAEEHFNEEAEYEVSEHEIRCFKNMVTDFVEFLHAYDLLNEYGELDEGQLDVMAEKMAQAYEEEDY